MRKTIVFALAAASFGLGACVVLPTDASGQPHIILNRDAGLDTARHARPRTDEYHHRSHHRRHSEIVHRAHGLCLDISRQVTDGAPLQLWPCNGRDNQQFHLNAHGEIRVGGKCLDIAQERSDNGTPVIAYRCHGGENQQWYRDGNAIRSRMNGKCLNVVGDLRRPGAQVKIWDCNRNAHQRFDWQD